MGMADPGSGVPGKNLATGSRAFAGARWDLAAGRRLARARGDEEYEGDTVAGDGLGMTPTKRLSGEVAEVRIHGGCELAGGDERNSSGLPCVKRQTRERDLRERERESKR